MKQLETKNIFSTIIKDNYSITIVGDAFYFFTIYGFRFYRDLET